MISCQNQWPIWSYVSLTSKSMTSMNITQPYISKSIYENQWSIWHWPPYSLIKKVENLKSVDIRCTEGRNVIVPIRWGIITKISQSCKTALKSQFWTLYLAMVMVLKFQEVSRIGLYLQILKWEGKELPGQIKRFFVLLN